MPEDAHAALLGTWSVSTESYEAALASAVAVRLSPGGVLQNGTWEHGAFVPTPPAGRSGPGFVSRYEVRTPTNTIVFKLDGAEERASYAMDGPDRWRTITGLPQVATVYYARRGH